MEIIRAALAHHAAGLLREAEAGFRAALAQPLADRVAADCWQHLAFVLEDAGRGVEAIEAYRAAMRLNPNEALIVANLTSALVRERRIEEAIDVSADGVRRFDRSPEVHHQHGVVLMESDRPDEALVSLDRAIALEPDNAEIHYNRGAALVDLRRFKDAIAALKAAIARRPEFAEAHAKLGMTLLTMGDFKQGWCEYEWRQRWTLPAAPRSWWDGSDLGGREIVLEAEQGLGDTIQLVRYADLVAARGGRVIVAAAKPLHRLLRRARGVSAVITPDSVAPDAMRVPLMSIPARFDNIPADVPYISAEPELVDAWGERISKPPMRIGVAWAGNPSHRDDRRRSCHPRDLASLAAVENATLYSLQVGSSDSHGFVDLSSHLTDLAETAAAMMHLDLIITVDTAVAHLAGALGRRVWVLLPFNPDWRWMLDREDSPWYPTMRLFRQRERGRWDQPVARIVEELKS